MKCREIYQISSSLHLFGESSPPVRLGGEQGNGPDSSDLRGVLAACPAMDLTGLSRAEPCCTEALLSRRPMRC